MVGCDMFVKVVKPAQCAFAMRTRVLGLGLTFARTNTALMRTRSGMFVGSSFVPSTSQLTVSSENSKVFVGTFVSTMSTFEQGLRNLATSFGTKVTLGTSCKKGLLAVKLVSLVKTERIRNTFADHKLFSNKGFFRSFELIDNLSRKAVCALGLDTLVNEFRTCEVGGPKVVSG